MSRRPGPDAADAVAVDPIAPDPIAPDPIAPDPIAADPVATPLPAADLEAEAPIALDATGRDLHAEADRLRARCPVARVELPGGVPGWSVTGYDAARRVLADPRFSKNARAHWPAFSSGDLGPGFPLAAWARMDNLATAHGPDHERQRRLVAKAFTARNVELMRPAVQKIVDGRLDALAALGPGTTVELKSGYAHPVAANVIGELLGVPEQDRLTALGAGYSGQGRATPQEMAAAFTAQRRAVVELIDAKRRDPGEDLTSALLAAREDDAGLTGAELVATVLLLLNTGTEPAMNLIANAAAALLADPAQRALAEAGRVSWAAVVDEALRVEAPVASMPFRFAVEDVDVAGVRVPAGEPVLVNFAAPGRDPALHGPDAGRFDAARPDKRHLAFGHGVHRCLGSALARLEAETALAGLFGRFPGLRLAVDPADLVPQETFIMNGRRELPVRLG
ncbi:cytochrome P450 family protein [Catenulispora subtropica]|uniref:Cytochrome P450 n=1 Tax=Catenulispora subtropica TaxID=450798 RepID=A0ABN2T2A8_9ACTN